MNPVCKWINTYRKVCIFMCISMCLTRDRCLRALTQRMRGMSDGVQCYTLFFNGLKQLHYSFIV